MKEYNEVYGWMPEDVISNLSDFDRHKLFLNWVLRKPTASGWFIVRAVVAKLGDGFIEYLFDLVITGLQGQNATKDEILAEVSTILDDCASDANVLMNYVSLYREEKLGLDDDVLETPCESEAKEKILPQRDEKGRFIKKK